MGFALYLCLLVVTFLRPAELFPALVDYQIVAVASVAALVGACISVITGRGPTLQAPQLYLVPLLTLWVAFSIVASERWYGGAVYYLGILWSSSALVFMLTALNVVTVKRLKITAGVIALMIVFNGAQGAYSYHFGEGFDSRFLLYQGFDHEEAREWMSEEEISEAVAEYLVTGEVVIRIRSLGFLNDPNDLAQALVSALPLLLCFRRPRQGVFNLLVVWIPVATAIYALSLTRSRGGLLALMAVTFLLLRKRLGQTLSMILSAGGLAALLFIGFVGGRQFSMDESSEGRTQAWYEGLQMLRESPIWGVGHNSFADRNGLVAHNSFVHCFAELGLVGYFIWLMLIVLTFSQLAAVARGSPETAGELGNRDPETPTGGEPDETGEEEGTESEEEELPRWAEASMISLIGFLVGGLFLSRTLSTMLFLLLGLGVGVGNVARRAGWFVGQRDPVFRTLQVGFIEVASIVLVWLAVRSLV